MSTILVRRSSTPSAVPASLAAGELAANTADGKLFLGTASSVVEVGAGGGGSLVESEVEITDDAVTAVIFSDLDGEAASGYTLRAGIVMDAISSVKIRFNDEPDSSHRDNTVGTAASISSDYELLTSGLSVVSYAGISVPANILTTNNWEPNLPVGSSYFTIDIGEAKLLGKISLYSDRWTTNTWDIQASGDGSNYVTVGSFVCASGTVTTVYDLTTEYRYYRFVTTQTGGGPYHNSLKLYTWVQGFPLMHLELNTAVSGHTVGDCKTVYANDGTKVSSGPQLKADQIINQITIETSTAGIGVGSVFKLYRRE